VSLLQQDLSLSSPRTKNENNIEKGIGKQAGIGKNTDGQLSER
jgi:hypothetical protein